MQILWPLAVAITCRFEPAWSVVSILIRFIPPASVDVFIVILFFLLNVYNLFYRLKLFLKNMLIIRMYWIIA